METTVDIDGRTRALIVGAGPGLSAAIARKLRADGATVALAARDPAKLAAFCAETGAQAYRCDATDPADVAALFAAVSLDGGDPNLVVFNASARARGPIETLNPADVQTAIAVSAFAGFLVAQDAARRMLAAGEGTILFTGASASVKGYAGSSAFAMGKFALRGLAQSLARELGPKNIHVAHVVIDGGIRSERRAPDPARPDALLDPEAIAEAYLALVRQPRSAWTHELDLRPWVETF
jgi:NAD(P)-dependent dehydrogenase (short-subunit alcohol dehydrogenase family)